MPCRPMNIQHPLWTRIQVKWVLYIISCNFHNCLIQLISSTFSPTLPPNFLESRNRNLVKATQLHELSKPRCQTSTVRPASPGS